MIDINRKYQTRDGRAVRILCVDRKAYSNESVMALISEKGGENIYAFHSDGHFYPLGDSDLDLVPVPTKHEGWMAIDSGDFCLYHSKEETERAIRQDVLTTPSWVAVHVTWED